MINKISIFYLLSLIVLLSLLPGGGFSAWTWEFGVRWFYFFLIAALTSRLSIPLSLYMAKKSGAIDMPQERSVHKTPIPRLGGMSVWLAFTLATFRSMEFSPRFVGVLTSSTIIYVLGAIDDIKKLSAISRLFFQILAASIVFFFGLKITFTSGHGFSGELISFILTVTWIVGILNAFNFMDGIDGLAASMGLICSLLLLVMCINTGQFSAAILSAALSGACIGFLRYNWNPASIFLGDGGSTFIGFLLGCLAIYATWGNDKVLPAFAGPLLILGIPIFDLFYTTISRIKNGKVKNFIQWLEYAGKDHFHHRLLNMGFSVKEAVFFIVLLNIILGLLAVQIVIDDKITETFINLFQGILVFMLVVFIMLVARNREKVV